MSNLTPGVRLPGGSPGGADPLISPVGRVAAGEAGRVSRPLSRVSKPPANAPPPSAAPRHTSAHPPHAAHPAHRPPRRPRVRPHRPPTATAPAPPTTRPRRQPALVDAVTPNSTARRRSAAPTEWRWPRWPRWLSSTTHAREGDSRSRDRRLLLGVPAPASPPGQWRACRTSLDW